MDGVQQTLKPLLGDGEAESTRNLRDNARKLIKKGLNVIDSRLLAIFLENVAASDPLQSLVCKLSAPWQWVIYGCLTDGSADDLNFLVALGNGLDDASDGLLVLDDGSLRLGDGSAAGDNAVLHSRVSAEDGKCQSGKREKSSFHFERRVK